MINQNRSKQDWSIGNTVKVGFMKLKIESYEAVKDGLPDIYYLSNPNNGKKYEFIPHNGLSALPDSFQFPTIKQNQFDFQI